MKVFEQVTVTIRGKKTKDRYVYEVFGHGIIQARQVLPHTASDEELTQAMNNAREAAVVWLDNRNLRGRE
jgi:hypothetical protein